MRVVTDEEARHIRAAVDKVKASLPRMAKAAGRDDDLLFGLEVLAIALADWLMVLAWGANRGSQEDVERVNGALAATIHKLLRGMTEELRSGDPL